MYVAVTRAMKQLFFTSCSSRMLYGKTQNYMPSRFIRDIPAEDIDISTSSYAGSGFRSGSSYYTGRPRQSYDFSESFDRPYSPKPVSPKPSSASSPQYYIKPQSASSHSSDDNRSAFPRFISTPSAAGGEYLTSVEPGERVRHKKFGDGTVKKADRSENGTIVEIVFDNSGMKRLILEFAKLLKI